MLNLNNFKPISGYEGLYLINEVGQIYSTKSSKILNPCKNRFGYMYVDLYRNNKRKHFKVHRLVAQAFLDNPDNLPQVNHIDGNKLNNNISNLEFCTAYQNTKHAWANGLKENARAAARKNGKITGKINVKHAQEARIKHLDDNLKELFDDIFINKLKNKNICKKYNLKKAYVSHIKNKRILKVALKEYQQSNLFQIWDNIL